MSALQDVTYALLKPIADRMPFGKLNLIHAFQNSGRVEKPYATIRIDTVVAPQHEIYFDPYTTGYQTFGGWRRANVEIQVYGNSAGESARRFMLALASNSSIEHQMRLNVAIGNRLMLSDIPELLNTSQFEERGIHQFELFYSDQMDDWTSNIEIVEIKQNVDGREHCNIIVDPPYPPFAMPSQPGEK